MLVPVLLACLCAMAVCSSPVEEAPADILTYDLLVNDRQQYIDEFCAMVAQANPEVHLGALRSLAETVAQSLARSTPETYDDNVQLVGAQLMEIPRIREELESPSSASSCDMSGSTEEEEELLPNEEEREPYPDSINDRFDREITRFLSQQSSDARCFALAAATSVASFLSCLLVDKIACCGMGYVALGCGGLGAGLGASLFGQRYCAMCGYTSELSSKAHNNLLRRQYAHATGRVYTPRLGASTRKHQNMVMSRGILEAYDQEHHQQG